MKVIKELLDTKGHEVSVIGPDDSVYEALRMMAEKEIGALVVLDAGKPVEVREVASLADSLGGGIGLRNQHTFDICRDLVDEVILLTESEIYNGMRALFYEDRFVAEGAAAVGHAAVVTKKIELTGPTAIVLSGRNVDTRQFADVVAGNPIQLNDVVVTGD